MKEDYDFLSSEEFELLMHRYKDVRNGKKANAYFDVFELEGLLDYHLDNSSSEDVSMLLQLADKQHPDATSIEIRRAKYFFTDGRIREAYELLNKIEKLEPSNHEVYLIKGMILIMDKRYNEAQDCFKLAIEKADGDLDEIYYTIAVSLETARQYKQAMRYFKKAYKESGDNDIELLYDLAYCSDKAGYSDDSVRYYHQYLDKNPFSQFAWFNLGVNYNNQEKYYRSIEAFDYALTIDPEYVMAMQGKADSLVQMEQYQEAINFYKRSIELSEEDSETLCEIGECYRMLDKPDTAVDYYNRSLKLDEQYADAWFGLGIIKYEENNIVESIVQIKHAIKIAPYNSDYWYALGLSCREISFKEDAEEAFEKALKLFPYDSDVWLTYAEMKYTSGEVERAIEVLLSADKYNKDTAKIKFKLAAYHFKTTDISSALNYFQEGMKINKSESSDFFESCPEAQSLDEFNVILSKFN